MIFGYKELYPKRDLPLMSDNIQPDRYPGQEKIASFLRSGGKELFSKLSHDKDVFTGKRLRQDTRILESGEYTRPSTLAYYVEEYNLRLPKDFEEYILSKEYFE